MKTERKCLTCGTWNTDNDYCINCSEILSPGIIEENREKVREEERQRKEEIERNSRLSIFFDRWKNFPFFPIRWLYYIVYTIWFIVMAIASFFAYIVVGANG